MVVEPTWVLLVSTMLLVILCFTNFVSGVFLPEAQQFDPKILLPQYIPEKGVINYPQIVKNSQEDTYPYEYIQPNAHIQPTVERVLSPNQDYIESSNCDNSDLIVKIWTMLKNFIEKKVKNVMNPDDSEIQRIIELFRDHPTDEPPKPPVVHIYESLKKLQNELNKANGNSKDSIRTVNNLFYNPLKKDKSKTKIIFKYELPSQIEINCKEAFVNLMQSAYNAYLQLLKNPICRPLNNLPNDLENYETFIKGATTPLHNQQAELNNPVILNLLNEYKKGNIFKPGLNDLFKNYENYQYNNNSPQKIVMPLPNQSKFDISGSKPKLTYDYINNILNNKQFIQTPLPETISADSETDDDVQLNADKTNNNAGQIASINDYYTNGITSHRYPNNQIQSNPNFNILNDVLDNSEIQYTSNKEFKNFHNNPNYLPNLISGSYNQFDNFAKNTAQAINVPSETYYDKYDANIVNPMYQQTQYLYYNRFPYSNLHNFYQQSATQKNLKPYQIQNLSPHKLHHKLNMGFLPPDVIGIANYKQQTYNPSIVTDNNSNLNNLLDVTNSNKLNTMPNKAGVIELTYLLKQQEAQMYQPFYFVKYKLPFAAFLNNMYKTLARKPYLKTNLTKLYKEAISSSKVIEVSDALKSFNKNDINKLVLKNGTLVKAKMINETDEPFKFGVVKPERNLRIFHSLGSSQKKLRAGEAQEDIEQPENISNIDIKVNESVTESQLSTSEQDFNKSKHQEFLRNRLAPDFLSHPSHNYNHKINNNPYGRSEYPLPNNNMFSSQDNSYIPGLVPFTDNSNIDWTVTNPKVTNVRTVPNPDLNPTGAINQ